MHVANRELCQELFELSGWEDVDNWYKHPDVVDDGEEAIEAKWEADTLNNPPAYDLDYLMLKLPEEYFLYKRDDWCVGNYRRNDWVHADTPQNAVCQILIELLKSNGLEKVEMV